ncbi:1311_t:CDS:1, partial [Racocetra fulgida]
EEEEANKRKRQNSTDSSKEKENEKRIQNLIQTLKESTNDVFVLKENLISFLKSRSVFSLSIASEAMLQAITELLLLKNCISELCLAMDNTKPKGKGRCGFVDIFFGDERNSIIELKYVKISNLMKGEKNN